MTGRIIRRRIFRYEHGRRILEKQWTPETGWTRPELDLARAKPTEDVSVAELRRRAAKFQPIPVPPEPLDAAALWGAPKRVGLFR